MDRCIDIRYHPRRGILDMVLCQIPTISPSNPGGGGVGDATDSCIFTKQLELSTFSYVYYGIIILASALQEACGCTIKICMASMVVNLLPRVDIYSCFIL